MKELKNILKLICHPVTYSAFVVANIVIPCLLKLQFTTIISYESETNTSPVEKTV